MEQTGRFCPNCGVPVNPGAAFCPSCGQQMQPQTPAQQPSSNQPPVPPSPHYAPQQPPQQYYTPPPHYTPTPAAGGRQYGKSSLFWIVWSVLAVLSAAILASGFSFLRFIGLVAVLAFPLLTRKSLFRKMPASAMSWVGVFVAFILVISLFPVGSGNDNSSSGAITIGKAISAASGNITTTGGTLTVNKTDDPLDGLVLTVPSASYDSSLKFEIFYSPVTNHSFGPNFNPVTPLISVENGGKYSSQMMEIKVPVVVPADSFAMGFIYDDATGRLEGMPLVAYDSTSIIVATRHFSSFIVSMIKKAELEKDINTGFVPGYDDWEFTNYGSAIAPNGHCAGQSMTAMWYYVTQPDGKDATLFGHYDNNGLTPKTPALWQDDSLAYRFASVIQEDQWDKTAYDYWQKLSGVDDGVTKNLFAYAMLITKEPQLVVIWSSQGGGHAMIVYASTSALLYISDPNYPGNIDRRIQYEGGAFKPYNSGANAADIAAGYGKAYESIEYWAKSAIVDYPHIASRWAEVKNGTIGNGKFPQYTLRYIDDQGALQELKDGTVWGAGKIKLRANSSFVTIAVQVYRDGVEIPWDESGAFELKPGSNRLGIYVTQIMPDGKFKYVDFRYVTVNFGGLALNPAVQDGEPNKPLTFNAILSNPLPAGCKIEWWADGALKKSGTEMSLSISFATVGNYDIAVRMVDSSGKTVLEDTGTVIIMTATTTTTKPATTATTTRPPTSIPTTISSAPTVTTGDTYNYAGALAAWMADEAARIASTQETTPTYVYTARLEWVVTPYIKDGNVMGASRIIATKTYASGSSDTWISNETFSAQNPGVYMTVAQLRAKYPQFAN